MNDPYWEVDNWTLAVTLNEQAAFIPQAIAAAMAAGVDRVAVYKLKDTEGDYAANPEPFGLMRWDDSRRPAYNTYRVAIRLLGGVTTAERERWDAVGQVRLEQGDTSHDLLFARLPGPQVARVRASADSADLVDMWGERETIDAQAGYFTVRLPGALCSQTIADYCMIGGTTYYLIQEEGGERPATGGGRPREGTPYTPEPSPPVELSPTRKPPATQELLPSATLTATPSATPYVVAALPPRSIATGRAGADCHSRAGIGRGNRGSDPLRWRSCSSIELSGSGGARPGACVGGRDDRLVVGWPAEPAEIKGRDFGRALYSIKEGIKLEAQRQSGSRYAPGHRYRHRQKRGRKRYGRLLPPDSLWR